MTAAPARSAVGIIVALPAESRSLGLRLQHKGDGKPLSDLVYVAVSGAGPVNARSAAEKLAGQGVRALLSWGCCAALAPALRPGALLLPDAVLADGRRIEADPAWRQRVQACLATNLAVQGGLLLQNSEIVATGTDKADLAASSLAIAVDMESAAIAETASEHGLPFLAIRAVADPSQTSIPPCVLMHTDSDGVTHLGGLLMSLARHPAELPGLLMLGRHFGAAMATLRQTAQLLSPGFQLDVPR